MLFLVGVAFLSSNKTLDNANVISKIDRVSIDRIYKKN